MMLEIALTYAHRGWHVFPVRGKVPLTEHGLHDASTVEADIRSMFSDRRVTGIGIACEPSGLFVVDLDGSEGIRTWRNLCAGDRPLTLVACTGKPDGFHLYYFGSGPSTSRRLGPGIDTRGRGGYVVAPPSLHESGRRYRWRDEPVAPVAPVPPWLRERLKPAPPPVVGDERDLPDGLAATRYGRAALEGLADSMLAACEGTRNETLVRVAYRAGRLAAGGELADDVAEGVLVEAARRTGLPVVEAVTTFSNGFTAGRLVPTRRVAR